MQTGMGSCLTTVATLIKQIGCESSSRTIAACNKFLKGSTLCNTLAARKGATLKADSASLAFFSFDRPRTHRLVLNASGKSEQCAYVIMQCLKSSSCLSPQTPESTVLVYLACAPASNATALKRRCSISSLVSSARFL